MILNQDINNLVEFSMIFQKYQSFFSSEADIMIGVNYLEYFLELVF